MAFDQVLKKRFGVLVMLPLVAIAALLNAQAVSQLIGVQLMPSETELAKPPRASRPAPIATTTTRAPSADPILARNAFDHVTGPLRPPAEATDNGAASSGALDTSDIWNVPVCDGINVTAIAASDDDDWSFAGVASSDGKAHLRRRGDDIGGKKVHFIGWDRVWFDNAGALCQVRIYDKKTAATPAPVATPTPTPAISALGPGRRGPAPVSEDIKKGIQRVSDTEFNIDRGTLDKILENQADLMRQARVIPVQENGRTVGIRMTGIRGDSLLGTLGMQNNDQLRTINGFDMSSPEKALEAYARLRTADKLTVQISRNGKSMNLDYNIR